MNLSPAQLKIIQLPFAHHLFLQGPAGSGKTTLAAARLRALLEAGVPGQHILVLVPQRTLAGPYLSALYGQAELDREFPPGGQPDLLTTGGLARRMVDLFWPLISSEAGFGHPDQPPGFLTLETAQYYMAHLVYPLLEQGFFDSITIDRNRLYSQIIDNLNKAALVGFPITEIGARLKAAWSGESSQVRVYDDAQHCAELFRRFCLDNNLLDFSLQVEIFRERLWPSLLCQAYLQDNYRHLIADNLEEDTPFTHDLLLDWLPQFESAWLLYDEEAGYRSFLSADRTSAQRLAPACDEIITLTESLVCPPELEDLGQRLGQALDRPGARDVPPHSLPVFTISREDPLRAPAAESGQRKADSAFSLSPPIRFYPQMLDWVAQEVLALLNAGISPGEIAILAPLLPDSLRFSLAERFDRLGVPYRSHRPSRPLGDEPPARCMLTLAQLAHPAWGLHPSKFEVCTALLQAIAGLDLVRAHLLVEIAYRPRDGRLESLDRLRPEMQERLTFGFGNRYEELRAWLAAYTADPALELDYFLSRLFGEILAQPGFGFHTNLDAGQSAANLIESAQKFRRAVEMRAATAEDRTVLLNRLGKEYFELVRDGVIAAQYVENWQPGSPDAVFIAPAYTFLMVNRPVAHQFWLDAGSNAWFERLYQPLTQPYVLSRTWTANRRWTAEDEFEHNRETLYRLVLGLLRRCRASVHLALCDLSESGYEQRGMLLKVIHQIQMQARAAGRG